MGRLAKKGLEYFPMDVDVFQDIKVRKLIRRQGGKSISVYVCLLCLIYESGYYIGEDEDLPFIISERTGLEEAYIQNVLECCLSVGLLDSATYQKHKVYTSRGIQTRYKSACLSAKRVVRIDNYNLISSEEKGISSEEKGISSEEKGISSEEKGISSEEKGISSEEKGISSEEIPKRYIKENKRKEKEKENIKEKTQTHTNNTCIRTEEAKREVYSEERKDYFTRKIAAYYNEMIVYFHSSIKPIKVLTNERIEKIANILRRFSGDDIGRAVCNAMRSDYLNGRTKRRQCPADFDWIFNENNFIKILEGNC